MNKRIARFGAVIGFLLPTLFSASAQAQTTVISGWTLNLSVFDSDTRKFGMMTGLDRLGYAGGFFSRGIGSGGAHRLKLVLNFVSCNDADTCLTSESLRLAEDFEITGFADIDGTTYSGDGGLTIIIEHTDGTLRLFFDATPDAVPEPLGFAGGAPSGGGMAGLSDDFGGPDEDDVDVIEIASFRLKPGGVSTDFNTVDLDGHFNATFQLISALPGVILDKDGNDLGARVASGGAPVLLHFLESRLNADPDGNFKPDTIYEVGPFGEECFGDLEDFCGILEAGFVELRETPGVKGALGDRVWVDLNGDGIQDCTDSLTNGNGIIGDDGDTGDECLLGVPGVDVHLLAPGGDGMCNTGDDVAVSIDPIVTDGDGFYLFGERDPGDYCVRFELPLGICPFGEAQFTAPAGGVSDVVTLSSGESDLSVDAGIVCSAALGDRVWRDRNGDGIQECGDGIDGNTGVECDPGIAGVDVILSRPNAAGSCLDAGGDVVGEDVTNADGFYAFMGLDPGNYCLRWNKPVGLECTLVNSTANPELDSDGQDFLDGTCGTPMPVTLQSGDDDGSWDLGLVAAPACTIAVDKTCTVPVSSSGALCEARIEATSLLYVGPDRGGPVTVTFQGKDAGSATYTNIDLVSGVTVLTDDLSDGGAGSEDGFTIAAGTNDGLGSKTSIFVDGVLEEVIHTSCSALYEAGLRAPLDAASPNLSEGGAKGDPSPNWFVVSFVDKNGGFVEEPGPDQPSDVCQVPFGGANVTYAYNITNLGNTVVQLTAVSDDIFGEVPLPPEILLAPGERTTTSIMSFVEEDTVNTATVSALIPDSLAPACTAISNGVTVTVEEAPPASCSDIKPVGAVSLLWNGSGAIDVITEAGELFENVQPGNRISIQRGGAGNDVDIAAFLAGTDTRVGASRFHLSCSDEAMNSADDCGSDQGNGKRNEAGLVNTWLLDGMQGSGGFFACDEPNTGVIDPSADGPGSAGVFANPLGPRVTRNELKWRLTNNGATKVLVTSVDLVWPAEQGKLKELKFGRAKFAERLDAPATSASLSIARFVRDANKRAIKAGRSVEFKAKFHRDYEGDIADDYRVVIQFDNGEVVTFNVP